MRLSRVLAIPSPPPSKTVQINILFRLQFEKFTHPKNLITHSMEGYQTDIQALLQDINGNYGNPEPEQLPQPPLPYSKPMSNSYKSQAERSLVPSNTLPTLYEAQLSRPSDAYSYNTFNDNGLDAYGNCSNMEIKRRPAHCYPDRALLAEPQSHSQWRANGSMRTLPAGRLSLPGHTAPHSPVNAFQQPKAQNQRRGRSR